MSDSETLGADWSENDESAEPAAWPFRPLLLALLGLATGLAAHWLLGNEFFGREPSALTLSEMAVLTVTAGLIGFTIQRRLWWAAVLFAVVCGVLAGAVVYWNGAPSQWSGGDGWRVACLFLAIAIAAPLFQAARDEGAMRFPYASVYDHAWSNIVLWGACWAFVGISFVLAVLLGALFHLIKLDFLQDLTREYWFIRALMGTAFGGALGLLREHDVVVGLLRRVGATVLAVLAPVLAVGLILFVLALPFTGLGALWDATSATTPILLTCVVGALILVNAVIGELPEHERKFPLLRFGAMGLGLVVFPLTVIAAIAIGLRIGQYGFTPERLWALTFVVIATAFAFAYLISLLRGRLYWAEVVRPANLRLAFAVCGIALLLATPLVSFNAISTRDQVARLESGKVSPEQFDWRALAFDFGQQGKDALKKFQASGDPTVKAKANEVAKAESRWEVPEADRSAERRAGVIKNLRVVPQGMPLPAGLLDVIATGYTCNNYKCTLAMTSANEALLFSDNCFETQNLAPAKARAGNKQVMSLMAGCGFSSRYVLADGAWAEAKGSAPVGDGDALQAGYRAGQIDVRKVERRQVFVGDQPVGDAFE